MLQMRSGDRLGPYEIISQLGAGGMGEVYRARDTRLAREVAIKILPPEFSNKKDRLERFEQEARSASALNHPNIITVFDIGSENNISYIAMEFVDGKTLRELLSEGRLSLRRSVSIAAQFAGGLAKAHAAGIIHRDLKPENLMISQDNFVKILDFGLAKFSELPSIGGSMLSTLAKTGEGTILGTVGYMSPEQASGKLVDFRSDQFSFGSILYEMITGKRAFARNTPVQSFSAIIQEEPESIGNLSPQTPAPIRWIIERCLAKDPEERYASTRDLARELQNVRDHFSDLGSTSEISGSAPIDVHRKWNWRVVLPWILLTLIGILLGVQLFKTQPAPQKSLSPRNVEILIPSGHILAQEAPLIFAPDGSAIVFGTTRPAMRGAQLWLRNLDRFETVPLKGTQGASHQFWSPDSKSIAFFVDEEAVLKRMELDSQSIKVICKTTPSGLRIAGFARGGSWGADGTILFTSNSNAPIQRVPANGGEPVDVTKLDPTILDGSHRYPIFLPDGQHFIFTLWSNHAETAAKHGGIYLASIQKGIIRKLTSDTSEAALAGNNQLLVYRNQALVALSIDLENYKIAEEGKQIVSNPLFYSASGALAASASRNGDLAFAVGAGYGTVPLSWLDNTGTVIGVFGHQRFAIESLILSPQGTRFAAQIFGRSGAEIWIGDTKREVLSRLSRGGSDSTYPVWSPDESRIAFAGQIQGSVSTFVQPADGTSPPEILVTAKDRVYLPTSWSNDGRYLLMDSNKKSVHGEIWLYDFSEKKLRPLLADPSVSVDSGSLSPDGHWLVYVSDESGNKEIFVRPFPSLDRKWQLSTSGGTAPHWRNDGREIIFSAIDQSIQSVKIELKENGIEAASPVLLFASKLPMMAMAPSSDHKRFLAALLPADVRAEPIHLILGWKPSATQK
jgi:serine/threonine protein kinase/WD40 repeat protein